MWRAFFLGLGFFCCFAGAECLLVDRAVLASKNPSAMSTITATMGVPQEEFTPPEWAPWSLFSGGAVVILYSLTLRRGG